MTIRRSLAAAAVACFMVFFGLASAHAAGSPDVVISQVYGGGGNSGATLKNDFIELYNRGAAAVDVSGWSVQYASSGGSSWQRTNLSGTIEAGAHYLIQEAQGAGGSVDLPAPDATGTIPMSATAGKVALVGSQTTIATGTTCPLAADFVGYGSAANCFEGSGPTAGLSNTTAALRKDDGATDTDDNAADFTVGAPNPRNHGESAPSIASRTPAVDATGVATTSNVTITFSEPVTTTGAWYSISCETSGTHTAAVSGGPTTFTLDPDADFATSESCTVTVTAALVSDQDANDPPDNPAGDESWTFTTEGPPPPPTAIHDIQGASHLSPKVGESVSNVQGIVTARSGNGFWMQDPSPDADPATSEGIFVFTSSAPPVAVGDAVSVGGTVQEFRPGSASNGNLTTTEIGRSTVTVRSSGNPLPAPILVGTGGRVPPSEVIEDDASGSVETSGTFDPQTDGIDFWESLEGMRVQLNDAVAVGPTATSFGETPVVGDNGANAGVRTARGGVLLRPTDGNPERVIVDDLLTPSLPDLNVGDHYDGPLVGVLDYNFGNFFLEVTQPVGGIHDGVTQETTTPAGADQLAVATFNVENLAPSDPQSKFDRLAGLFVHNLGAPDIVSVEEVQDNSGATDDGVVAADQTLAKLIGAIQAAGGPAYEYREIDPVDDQDGGQPGGNIRQVFLFRSDRGVAFVDRPGGGSTTDTTVVAGANGPELSASPGRIDPNEPNGAWASSRKPLAGEFTFNGHRLFVIANHFNSKGGDDPLLGRFQPPTLSSEMQRHKQAQIVHDFVKSILDLDPKANVIVDGDLNDFEFSQTVSILEDGVLTDLIDTLPLEQRYSYEFEGNAQVLDHILVSGNLADDAPAYDVVHVNSEFADQASDHDPSVVRLTMPQPTIAAAAAPAANPAGWNNTNVTVTYTCTDPLSALVACPVRTILSTEGTNQSATGTAVLKAGGTISATVSGVSIDKTPPQVTYSGNTGAYTVDQTVDITCAATDALSLVASTTCANITGPAYAFALGTNTFSAAATDNAGNTSTATTTFTVGLTTDSLCALVQRFTTRPDDGKDLCNKLAQYADGGGSDKLTQFQRKVADSVGKSLTAEQADTLIRLSRSL